MYSVVMLMAMAAAPETPNCHWMSSGCGCWGSSSSYGSWGSCYGSGYAGSSWGGCYGSSYSSCYGCYGSGYGYGSYNCTGYGIYGGTSYSWPTPYTGGCGGCYGYGYPSPPPVWNAPRNGKVIDPKPKSTFAPISPNQAQVVVSLPADATLFANGQLTALTSSERSFVSPTLESGRDYQYNLKVEYVRDGKTVTDSQIVKVRAGEVSRVQFADSARSVASTVKVVMPEGAKLFVNDQPRELPTGIAEFKTPPLTKGSEYTHTFRAETTVGGKKQEQTKRIVFKAGEAVTVDFSEIAVLRTVAK